MFGSGDGPEWQEWKSMQLAPLAPLPLPRFTFFIGPPESRAARDELSVALGNRDRTLSYEDLDQKLRDATLDLFGGTNISPCEGWTGLFRAFFEIHHGEDILSRLVIAEINAESFSVIERFVFRDARGIADIRPFARTFGTHNILACHFHTNKNLAPSNIRNVWFPTHSVSENMQILEREFGQPVEIS